MSKKFHDDDRTLEVQENGGKINLYIEGKINELGVEIAPSDAPTLALTILEAAGVKGTHRTAYNAGSDWQLEHAAGELSEYVRARSEYEAEAEAQAKLEAEALELYKTYWSGNVTGFSNEPNRDDWINVACRAREINKENQ